MMSVQCKFRFAIMAVNKLCPKAKPKDTVQWRRKMFCCRGAENTVPCGGLTGGLSSQ